MSSAIYLKFNKSIPLEAWEKFCKAQAIEHSTNTVGGNKFYFRGPFGIEICFGDSDLSQKAPPFRPPEEAKKVTVSTFHMGDLEGVAQVAKWILERWFGSYDSDLELKARMLMEAKR
jgi:hypothetical protein